MDLDNDDDLFYIPPRRPEADFLAAPESWTEDAKCAGSPPGEYDIENLPTRGAPRYARARQLCSGCMVLADCASWAYRTKSIGHVYAGIPVPLDHFATQFAALRAIAERAGKAIE